jgi:hypothetical protein
MTMDNAFAVSISCLFLHKNAPGFAPLDRSCKDE